VPDRDIPAPGPDPGFLGRLKSGDAEAFRELVSRYQGQVYRICHRFLLNAEDAEDAAQDVFVEAYQAIRSFREEADLGTWLYRIATTKSLDAIRRKNRKKRRDGFVGLFKTAEADDGPPAAASGEPDRLYEVTERVAALREAVAALPEKQRIAVTLSDYEGYGTKEIAAILETTVLSVDSLLYRGHQKLRNSLSRHYAGRREGEA